MTTDASEGDSSVGIRSVGELGHYGLLPCAWGYALMHDQADRPAALCGGPGLRSHAPTGVAALCGINYLDPGRTACAFNANPGFWQCAFAHAMLPYYPSPGSSTEKARDGAGGHWPGSCLGRL